MFEVETGVEEEELGTRNRKSGSRKSSTRRSSTRKASGTRRKTSSRKTTARKTPDGWRLDGTKIYSTGSTGLRWYGVWAKTDEPDARVGQARQGLGRRRAGAGRDVGVERFIDFVGQKRLQAGPVG